MLREQLLEGHRHHHGGVDSRGLRGAVHRVALDVLHERLAQPPPQRLPLAGVVPELVLGVASRVGQREQVALEHLPHVRGHREPAVAPARAVVDQDQLHARIGPCFLGRQHGRLVALPHLGGDHVEDPLPDLLQVTRVVVAGEAQQRRLRPPPGLFVDVDRQRVDRLHDHARLLGPKCTGGQRRGHLRVRLQRPAQRQVASRLALRRTCLDREPCSNIAQTVRLAHVVRGGKHPGRERVQLRPGLGQRDQRGLLLRGAHERRLHAAGSLQRWRRCRRHTR